MDTVDGLAGTAGHHRLTMGAGMDVASALRECASGERVMWDVMLQLVPTPEGPRPMLMIYMHIPAAVLGELCAEMVLIEPRFVTADNIGRNVRATMERLRKARTASMSQNGAGGGR